MNNTSRECKFVVRRIRNKPIFFKDGRPSSALFKDSKGVSVDKDEGRTKEEIIKEEENLHKFYNSTNDSIENEMQLKAIISVTKETCDNHAVQIIDSPLEENKHHALLQKSETIVELTKGQAKALAKSAEVLKEYNVN